VSFRLHSPHAIAPPFIGYALTHAA